MTAQLSDEELMKAYVEGDSAAFEVLYARYARKVYGFLKTKMNNSALADEAFQATFLKLHRSRGKYDPSLPFVPWLFTLCRNEMIDSLRLQKTIKEDPFSDTTNVESEVATLGHTESEQEVEMPLNTLIGTLSQREQQVVLLRYGQDFSFDEIAKRLNIKSANARKLSQRAIEKLKSLWK